MDDHDVTQKQSGNFHAEAKIERFISPESTQAFDAVPNESAKAIDLRPKCFGEFPGQDRAKANLNVFVQAAKKRDASLDHVLLHGPPGLGKTSLARIIALELGVEMVQTSGPAIEKPGDLAGLLSGLPPKSVLFVDEIHRLSINIEEVLYSAMEDFFLDIIIGQGPTARSVKMDVEPFTLIGATTRVANISRPLISRFGIQERFEYYDFDALKQIIIRSSELESIDLCEKAAESLASRSRGTPRIANRLLKRVRDFAIVRGEAKVSIETVNHALAAMEIDVNGLEPLDRKILSVIRDVYSGGPVGIEALAQTVGEDRSTLEEVYEPFLVHQQYVRRGPRGREITDRGLAIL